MDTNPLLARRVISLKERLQKSLLVVLLTAVAVGGIWIYAGASRDIAPRFALLMAAAAALGTIVSALFLFKKYESAQTKEEARFVRRRIDDDRKGSGWLGRLTYTFARFLTGVVVVVGLLITLGGVGVLALQVYGYLKTGGWQSVSLQSVAVAYVPWLNNPQSWFGLHQIVRRAADLLPLSLALVVLGWMIAGFGSALRHRVSR
ncbi:MAG: hypothetical protein WBN07_13750 [Woeseiaceae bacterium]